MKTIINQITTALGLLIFSLLLTIPVFAQTTQKKEKDNHDISKKDGTIHLRIEKYENGQKKVYERTYKDDEFDFNPFPDGFMFNSDDSLDSFKMYGKNLLDSIHILNPSGKIFFDSLGHGNAENEFFFRHNLDSLLNSSGHMFYNFNHSFMPDMDSLLRKSMDTANFLFKDMGKDFQFHFDTLFNKGFDLRWDDNFFPFNGDDMNLLLDKEQYDIQEIEKDGRSMIKITPKKSAKNQDEAINSKKPENTPNSMQPSDADLNLILNPATATINLRFQVPSDGLTIISITNAKGKQVYKEKVKNKAGVFTKQINLSKEGPGVFTVNIKHHGKNLSEKVTIQ